MVETLNPGEALFERRHIVRTDVLETTNFRDGERLRRYRLMYPPPGHQLPDEVILEGSPSDTEIARFIKYWKTENPDETLICVAKIGDYRRRMMMPKIDVEEVEWYPVWVITEEEGKLEVSDETLSRWRRVFYYFKQVQEEIEEATDKLFEQEKEKAEEDDGENQS